MHQQRYSAENSFFLLFYSPTSSHSACISNLEYQLALRKIWINCQSAPIFFKKPLFLPRLKKFEKPNGKIPKDDLNNGTANVELTDLISNMRYEVSMWASSEYGIGPKTKEPVTTNQLPPIWEIEQIDNSAEKIKISWTMPKPGYGNVTTKHFEITLYDEGQEKDEWKEKDRKFLDVSNLTFDKHLNFSLEVGEIYRIYALVNDSKIEIGSDRINLKSSQEKEINRNHIKSIEPKNENPMNQIDKELNQNLTKLNCTDGNFTLNIIEKMKIIITRDLPPRENITIKKDEDTECQYELINYSNENKSINFTIDRNEISYEFVNLKPANNYAIDIVPKTTEEFAYSSSSNIKREKQQGEKFYVSTLPPKLSRPNISNPTQHSATIHWQKPMTLENKSTRKREIYYSVKYKKWGKFEAIKVTTNETEFILKDLAANSLYEVSVQMKTDFANFALFGEGQYSNPRLVQTLEIVRTFKDELCERLGVYDLKNATEGTYFIKKLL